VCLAFSLEAAGNWNSDQESARIALEQHDYAQASQLFAECVGLSRTREERARALASYGIALRLDDRNTEAKLSLEAALAEWPDTRQEDRVVTSGVLAAVDRSLGDYTGAERILRAAIADRFVSQGNRSTLMVNLADLFREEGRENEAIALMTEADRLSGLPREQQTGILVERAELTRDMHVWNVSIGLWEKIGEIAASEHSAQLEEVYTAGLGVILVT
jgi:tetratricopeptide (TPR) repeat protein